MPSIKTVACLVDGEVLVTCLSRLLKPFWIAHHPDVDFPMHHVLQDDQQLLCTAQLPALSPIGPL